MKIRRLVDADLHSYKALRLLSLQTDPDAYFLNFEHAKNYSDGWFLAEMTKVRTPYGFYGAFLGDKLVGMICIEMVAFKLQQIFTFYVKPEFRGRSIGRQLLQYVLDIVPNGDCVRLTVTVGNAAVKLYKDVGFMEVAVRAHALTNARGTFDQLVLEKTKL